MMFVNKVSLTKLGASSTFVAGVVLCIWAVEHKVATLSLGYTGEETNHGLVL